MSDGYTTSTRALAYPEYQSTFGYVGRPGSHLTYWQRSELPSEVTYSYRTKRQESGFDYDIPDADTRVTRNGFTTYNPETDKGHEFWTLKNELVNIVAPEVYLMADSEYGRVFWRGNVVPKLDFSGGNLRVPFQPNPGLTSDEVTSFGQRAILNSAPTSPQASAAVFLGELREGLPSGIGVNLWKNKAQVVRGAGSEFLNVQFGWLPLIKDIRKAVAALQNATKIVQQLSRDNGRVVRRRFAFPGTVSSTEGSFLSFGGPYNQDPSKFTYFPGTDHPTLNIRRIERSIWFSGAFSYSIPVDSSLLSKLEMYSARANVLMGARFSPDVLWELAPWSWLIDWKLSIGQCLSTATRLSEDGLVIRYGYLMAKTVIDDTYMVNPLPIGFGQTIPLCSVTLRSERKERLRATPFGFGLNTADFTDSQWRVLAALGMSRTPR